MVAAKLQIKPGMSIALMGVRDRAGLDADAEPAVAAGRLASFCQEPVKVPDR